MINLEQAKEITTAEAAQMFGIARATFHAMAKRYGIQELTEINPARSRPIVRVYSRSDVLRVYRELYGKDPE